jgi:hypothetical protein
MAQTGDRADLDRRLEQARRGAKDHDDPVAKERLSQLILDLEEQLRNEKAAHGLFKRADELEQQASDIEQGK